VIVLGVAIRCAARLVSAPSALVTGGSARAGRHRPRRHRPDQAAEVLVRRVLSDAAIGRTFELFAGPGYAPSDWHGLLAAVRSDTPPRLDGAAESDTLHRLDAEPQVVQDDVARLATT
jgi:hypothetical protein